MIPRLEYYRRIVGTDVIKKIKESAEPLQDKHVVHVNSTAEGGGVAEMLNTLVFLMNDVGIETGWRILRGSHSFFKITKGFHNSLQGKPMSITKSRREIYEEYCERNSIITHIKDHDIVVIHDPQPLGMISEYQKKTTWLWRCHIDLSSPYYKTMDYLLPFIKKYDGVVISSKKFRIKGAKKPQFIINPSIDPLSPKNIKITHRKAKRLLSSRGIDTDKPILTQISRFDPWKDHHGVLKIYDKVREKQDCQLVLMGDMASDDPEGPTIFHKIKKEAENIPNVHIITEKNDLLVNALQQESAIVFQNSKKEGFALTVSEAMWKKTPVIGTDVGGIPLQIMDGRTGYIIHNHKDGVDRTLRILGDDALRKRMGRRAKEHIRKNFLVTRHLQDYIDLFNRYYPKPDLKEFVWK
jgi:trehalose synthase